MEREGVERGGMGGGEREKHPSVASLNVPHQGSNPNLGMRPRIVCGNGNHNLSGVWDDAPTA